VGGEAVQHEDVRPREVHELLAHLVARKHERSLVRLHVLPHARPHVGVERVGADRRLLGIVGELDRPAGLGRDLLGPVHHLGNRLEPRRRGDPDRHAGLGPRQQERVGDVVAVAEVREHAPVELAQTLTDRQEIRERLTRMLEVGEGVHDRHRGRRGQDLESFLLECPQDDPIDVA
jgi:hypothetical protein